MTERPILFSAPMVRAILEGRKTQTRRAVKPEGAHHLFQFRGKERLHGADEPTGEWAWCSSSHVVSKHIRCPYGLPSDRLWVREAWAAHWMYDDLPPAAARSERDDLRLTDNRWFRADGDAARSQLGTQPDGLRGKWRPSIHMPRWASRILLAVTAVRVERLQHISEADARAEGITDVAEGFGLPDGSHFHAADPRMCYASLWEQINGPGSWDANPWVWVIEFKRIEP